MVVLGLTEATQETPTENVWDYNDQYIKGG